MYNCLLYYHLMENNALRFYFYWYKIRHQITCMKLYDVPALASWNWCNSYYVVDTFVLAMFYLKIIIMILNKLLFSHSSDHKRSKHISQFQVSV